MQHSVNKLSEACSNFVLTISTKKAEVMHQPAPGKPYAEPNIHVNGQRLSAVDKFTYLGSTLSSSLVIEDEVNARIAKANVAFGRLRSNVWSRRGISLPTKPKFYRAIALPMLLYACETWTIYQRHARKLNHLYTTCLRRLMNIKWQDKVSDTKVLARELPSIHTILMQHQLWWAGHLVRMSDDHPPQKTSVQRAGAGKSPTWRPEKTFQGHSESVIESLQHCSRPLGRGGTRSDMLALLCPQRSPTMRGHQDSCCSKVSPRQEGPCCWPTHCARHPMPSLPEDISDPDRLGQSPTPTTMMIKMVLNAHDGRTTTVATNSFANFNLGLWWLEKKNFQPLLFYEFCTTDWKFYWPQPQFFLFLAAWRHEHRVRVNLITPRWWSVNLCQFTHHLPNDAPNNVPSIIPQFKGHRED